MKHKRITIIAIVAAMLVSVAGCSKDEQANTPVVTTTTTATTTVQVGGTDDQTATTTAEEATTDTTGTVQSTTGQTEKTEKAEDETTEKKTTTTTGQKKTTTTAKKETKKTTTTTKKATKATTTTAKKITTTTKKASTTTKVTSQYDKVATAADARTIADRVIYYINKYRTQQGSVAATKLPGLTKVAEYRSKQLVTNFAHDTTDQREAYTKYQYGEYIDTAEWGIPGPSYYSPKNCREAIASDVVWGGEIIDAIAKNVAEHYKSSSDHWSYVGSSDYPYIAVGLTYSNERWYSCIKVASSNQYG